VKCYVYVDGQYLREQFRTEGESDFIDPTKPAQFVRNFSTGSMSFQLMPVRIFYYDAVNPLADKVEEQRAYLRSVSRLPITHVVEGEVRQGKRKFEQKGVDVRLAVDALQAAYRGAVEAIAIVSGDADFIPLVRAIRDIGPHIFVLGFRTSFASGLAQAADMVWLWDSLPTDWHLTE
jgi:uncharacterized LabA/DUF88 family protein